MIEGKEVDFDVRFLGDGYYDKCWQANMLKNRVLTKDNVQRMTDLNYFYSLLWHAKIQKEKVKEEYVSRLKELADKIGIEGYEGAKVFDNFYVASLLSDFCLGNHYSYEQAYDIVLPLNREVFDILHPKVTGRIYRIAQPISLKRKIIGMFPGWIIKTLLESMKNLLKILLKL